MATLVTKAKEILIAAWNGETAPVDGTALEKVIADTLSVTQEDAEEQTFEFETTDTPETFYTAGAYTVDLNNAEISEYFLVTIMGWDKITDPEGYAAPEAYENRYVSLQVKFADDFYLYIPKIAISPKLVFESVKTSLAYGTLSGKATNYNVGGKNTSICVLKKAKMTKTAA